MPSAGIFPSTLSVKKGSRLKKRNKLSPISIKTGIRRLSLMILALFISGLAYAESPMSGRYYAGGDNQAAVLDNNTRLLPDTTRAITIGGTTITDGNIKLNKGIPENPFNMFTFDNPFIIDGIQYSDPVFRMGFNVQQNEASWGKIIPNKHAEGWSLESSYDEATYQPGAGRREYTEMYYWAYQNNGQPGRPFFMAWDTSDHNKYMLASFTISPNRAFQIVPTNPNGGYSDKILFDLRGTGDFTMAGNTLCIMGANPRIYFGYSPGALNLYRSINGVLSTDADFEAKNFSPAQAAALSGKGNNNTEIALISVENSYGGGAYFNVPHHTFKPGDMVTVETTEPAYNVNGTVQNLYFEPGATGHEKGGFCLLAESGAWVRFVDNATGTIRSYNAPSGSNKYVTENSIGQYGEMLVNDSTDKITFYKKNLYDGVDYLVSGSQNGFTFIAGSSAAFTRVVDKGEGRVKITSNGHGLAAGDIVTVQGAADYYNGTFSVMQATSDSFLITAAWHGTTSGSWHRPSSLKAKPGTRGTYLATLSGSAKPDSAPTSFKFGLHNQTAAVPNMSIEVDYQFAGARVPFSKSALISIDDSDTIWLGIINLTDTSSLNLSNTDINLVRVQ
jgi:hypothetical protein